MTGWQQLTTVSRTFAPGRRDPVSETKRRPGARRNSDPVRVYADKRLAYWTGGIAGQGKRVFERFSSVDEAEVRATQLRERFALHGTAAERASTTLREAFVEMMAHLQQLRRAPGTIRQYRSNWNKWIPQDLDDVLCCDASIEHWTSVFDAVVRSRGTESTVKNVARTLNAFRTWGVQRGYFDTNAFGNDVVRRGVVKRARADAKQPDTPPARVRCPSVAEIGRFGDALEKVYPDYGRRLVLLGFATGMRIAELLALRYDAIDFETLEVRVDVQLDRSRPFPAIRKPKGNKTRTAFLWSAYVDVARSLVDDSLSRELDDPLYGWLFPPYRSTKAWADQASNLIGEAIQECEWKWTFHWLRHAYATFSLTARESGGYGLDLKTVSEWLGHSKPSTTQNMYLERHETDVQIARELTALPPHALHGSGD